MADAETLEQDLPDEPAGPPQYSSDEIQGAMRMAHQNNDMDSLKQLHGMLLEAYQRESPKVTDDMSGMDRFIAGAGHGAQRLGEGIANLVGVKGKAGGFDSTNQGLKDEDHLAQPLLDTPGGWWGDLAGQTAATLPLTMGTGALAGAGEKALAKVAPAGAAKLATWAAANPWKAKVLLNAGKTADAATQGGVQAAAMSDPDQQVEAGGKGAVLAAALGKLGQVGGRLVRGLVQKSPAAKALEEGAASEGRDIFVPISQGASDKGISGAAKSTYKHILPFALGVEDRLAGQAGEAGDVVRNVTADMQRPDFLRENGGVKATDTVEGKTAEETGRNLADVHEADTKNAFDMHAFESPFNFRDQVVRELDRTHPNMPEPLRDQLATVADQNLALFTRDGQLTGENLRDAISATQRDMDKLGKNYRASWKDTALQPFRDIVDTAIDHHEGILRETDNPKDIKAAQQFLDDMANYKSLAAKDKGVANIVSATKAVPERRGAYAFKDALRGETPGTPAYRFLQNAHEVLGEEDPGSVSSAGRHVWHTVGGLMAPALGFATGHGRAGVGFPAAFEAGSHILASKPVQKALYGDLGSQRALAQAIRNNPAKTRYLGAAGRAATVAGLGENQ